MTTEQGGKYVKKVFASSACRVLGRTGCSRRKIRGTDCSPGVHCLGVYRLGVHSRLIHFTNLPGEIGSEERTNLYLSERKRGITGVARPTETPDFKELYTRIPPPSTLVLKMTET